MQCDHCIIGRTWPIITCDTHLWVHCAFSFSVCNSSSAVASDGAYRDGIWGSYPRFTFLASLDPTNSQLSFISIYTWNKVILLRFGVFSDILDTLRIKFAIQGTMWYQPSLHWKFCRFAMSCKWMSHFFDIWVWYWIIDHNNSTCISMNVAFSHN